MRECIVCGCIVYESSQGSFQNRRFIGALESFLQSNKLHLENYKGFSRFFIKNKARKCVFSATPESMLYKSILYKKQAEFHDSIH